MRHRGIARSRALLSRAKFVLASRLPQSVYWDLMGTFKAVPAVTSQCSTLAESEDSGQHAVGLLQALGVVRRDTVALEIGSGLGRIARNLAPQVARVYGIDVSRAMIRRARRIGNPPNVEFVCVPGDSLERWHNKSLDLVYSFLVFQHLPRIKVEKYLTEGFRTLRPSGWIVFQVMIDETGDAEEPPDSHPYGLRKYTRDDVSALLTKAGFTATTTFEMDGSSDRMRRSGDIVFAAAKGP